MQCKNVWVTAVCACLYFQIVGCLIGTLIFNYLILPLFIYLTTGFLLCNLYTIDLSANLPIG